MFFGLAALSGLTLHSFPKYCGRFPQRHCYMLQNVHKWLLAHLGGRHYCHRLIVLFCSQWWHEYHIYCQLDICMSAQNNLICLKWTFNLLRLISQTQIACLGLYGSFIHNTQGLSPECILITSENRCKQLRKSDPVSRNCMPFYVCKCFSVLALDMLALAVLRMIWK